MAGSNVSMSPSTATTSVSLGVAIVLRRRRVAAEAVPAREPPPIATAAAAALPLFSRSSRVSGRSKGGGAAGSAGARSLSSIRNLPALEVGSDPRAAKSGPHPLRRHCATHQLPGYHPPRTRRYVAFSATISGRESKQASGSSAAPRRCKPEGLRLGRRRGRVAADLARTPAEPRQLAEQLGVLERCHCCVDHGDAELLLELLEEAELCGAAEDDDLGAVRLDRFAARGEDPATSLGRVGLEVMDSQVDHLERRESVAEAVAAYVVAHLRHPLPPTDDDRERVA